MELSGKQIALRIFAEIRSDCASLPANVLPTLVIITLGKEVAWEAYVQQKLKRGAAAGINTIHNNLSNASQEELIQEVERLNKDSFVHGVIIQRPLPVGFDTQLVANTVLETKDVDGFRTNSPFEVPVFLAVKRLLQETSYLAKLKNQTVTVIGKGESAGKLIINGLRKIGISPQIIDSQTANPQTVLKLSDIIISCVGKTVLHPQDLKPGVILIGVGIHRDNNGKLKGDYNEEEVKDIASYYTPTPGGVGPLNLAYLFKNVIKAAILATKKHSC